MFFPFVLFVVSLVCYIHKQPILSAEMTFPEDLHTWCPETKFCHATEAKNHGNTPTRKDRSDTNTMKCCEECSCSADCGLKRNCCTSEYDQYKLDEKLGTICKPLNNQDGAFRDANMYHMIDKCPNKDHACNSVNISSWGSFSPVYSPSSGMIYYNSLCASCNNQTGIVEFAPVISFPYLTGIYSTVFSNVLNGKEEEAYLEFLVPDDIEISTEVCYPYMIRDCMKTNSGQDNIKDLCRSFNATFHAGFKTYQNVYCYLCGQHDISSNDKWLEDNVICPAKVHDRRIGQLSLIVFLDPSSPIDNHDRSTSDAEQIQHNCIDVGNSSVLQDFDVNGSALKWEGTNGECAFNLVFGHSVLQYRLVQECREVFCPEAHIRVKDECVVVGHTWYVRQVQLYVKLTPLNSRALTVYDLIMLTTEELDSKDKSFIHRPGLEQWEMALFYRADRNKTVQYILAILFMGSQTVRSKTFLTNIQRSLQSTWKLHINGQNFELQAEFNKFIGYESFPSPSGMPVNGTGGRYAVEFAPKSLNYDNPRNANFRVMNLSTIPNEINQPNALLITRLFFCEQVNLRPSDFIRLSFVEVFLVNQRKYLGNGDFVVDSTQSGFLEDTRVCLSDVQEVTGRAAHVINDVCFLLLHYGILSLMYLMSEL